jgi:hypothetical protein
MQWQLDNDANRLATEIFDWLARACQTHRLPLTFLAFLERVPDPRQVVSLNHSPHMWSFVGRQGCSTSDGPAAAKVGWP